MTQWHCESKAGDHIPLVHKRNKVVENIVSFFLSKMVKALQSPKFIKIVNVHLNYRLHQDIPFIHPMQKAVCVCLLCQWASIMQEILHSQPQTMDIARANSLSFWFIELLVQCLDLLFQYLDTTFQSTKTYCFNLLIDCSITARGKGKE